MSTLKITISIFFILLLYNCQTIDFNELESKNSTNTTIDTNSSNSLDTKEYIICITDTAIFYAKYKYNIVLAKDTLPYIKDYRIIYKNEVKLLRKYIKEDKRVLCFNTSGSYENLTFYTFIYNGPTTKAGYKTEYYYIPIRTERIITNDNLTISINTKWKEENILVH